MKPAQIEFVAVPDGEQFAACHRVNGGKWLRLSLRTYPTRASALLVAEMDALEVCAERFDGKAAVFACEAQS